MYKFLIFFLLLAAYHLLLPTPTFAHLAGQPPYLRINGQYTNLYPVLVSSAPNFNLPQDLAVGNFKVSQKIDFSMEVGKLPAPPEVVKKTKFTWDYGDGSPKDTGLSTSHIYNKMGSYFQLIYADDGSTTYPQLLSSVLINVLPDENYKLPQAVIFVDGIAPKDPLTDPLKFDLTQNLAFDGSKSESGTGKIVSYSWDLGDGTTQVNPSFNFQYSSQVNQVFPVLRVKDENGFISDSFVELETGNPAENTSAVKVVERDLSKPGFFSQTGSLVLIMTFPVVIIVLIVIFRKRKKQ